MKDVLIWITCRNYERYLIQSVGSAARQTGAEVHVSHDDCGQANPIGTARNRNQVLYRPDLADFRYVIFLDADDFLPTFYVDYLINVASGDECIVTCDGQEFGNRTGLIRVAHPINLQTIGALNTIHVSSLISTRILLKHGGFDPDLSAYEDWDYWVRLAAKRVEFRYCPDTRLLVRKHSDSRHETKTLSWGDMSSLIQTRYGVRP